MEIIKHLTIYLFNDSKILAKSISSVQFIGNQIYVAFLTNVIEIKKATLLRGAHKCVLKYLMPVAAKLIR